MTTTNSEIKLKRVPNPNGAPPKFGESMTKWPAINFKIHPLLYERLKDDTTPMADKIRELVMKEYGITPEDLKAATETRAT